MARVIIPGRANSTNLAEDMRGPNPNYPDSAENLHMVLSSRSVGEVKLQYSPRRTQHTGLAPQWDEVPRSGQQPLVVSSAIRAERMSFEVTLATTQPGNITAELQALKRMARSKDPITVRYTTWEGLGLWRISEMDIEVIQRSSIDHSPTMATGNLELISLGGDSQGVGMLSGGLPGGGAVGVAVAARTYVVREGDTAWSIAQRFYGTGENWTILAADNRLTRPRRELTVGRTLIIRSDR